MIKDLTPSKFVFIIFIISLTLICLVSYYGGYIKDAITKNTCNLIGEEYENGYKKGEGRCITPVGKFD
ncbi:MAG: hypothetical protein GX265_01135 [Mollicutes bacterium]|jgi:hypothetical protein|nr:hypothetical protein [Mollicutes bacterium]